MLEILNQRGKAMIHSSRRDSKTKAIAEVLAMIADAHPELAPHPRSVRETEAWLWESATAFCAALDRYAGRCALVENAAAFGRPQWRQRAVPCPCSNSKCRNIHYAGG